jgi:predicted DNA-binding transcriptional regulator AlpA
MTNIDSSDSLLSFPQLAPICPIKSRVTIGKLIAKDHFPAPVRIGRNCYWLRSEVVAWLAAKKTPRPKPRVD